MPLFECEQCHCVENTATGEYWGRQRKLCSECGTGEWHGIFEKKPAAGMIIDECGFLWSRKESMPDHIKAVGVVGGEEQHNGE